MAGIHNPDLLRKATGKKNPKLLAQVKPELESKLKERGWSQEQFNSLWEQMLEFAKYSFNKAHSAAYAIIGYLTAKQKAYYPSEFYAGLCNSYIGKSEYVRDNAEEIISDAEDHKIKIIPFNFRQDHRRCRVENGQLIYGIPLIKDCSLSSAEIMFQCSGNVYNNFFELLSDLYSNGINKKQVDIFIKLGFFSEFGNSKFLLKAKAVYEFFKDGAIKQISKDKVNNPTIHEILSRYCSETDKNYCFASEKMKQADKVIALIKKKIKKEGETIELSRELKQYTEKKEYEYKKIMKSILNECYEWLLSISVPDFTLKEKIADSKQYLGFIHLTTNKEEDRRKLLVNKVIPLKSKTSDAIWGYAIFTKSIGSGKSSRLTVKAKVYNSDPINELNIVYAKAVEKNNAGYWYLIDYQKII